MLRLQNAEEWKRLPLGNLRSYALVYGSPTVLPQTPDQYAAIMVDVVKRDIPRGTVGYANIERLPIDRFQRVRHLHDNFAV